MKHAGRAALGATIVAELAFLGYDLYSDYQLYTSGEISRKEFCKRATSSSAGSVGSLGGAAAGAAVGTAFFPGVGTFIGGVFGGVTGYFGGKAVGSEIGEKLKHFCEGDEEIIEDSTFHATFENNDDTMIVEDLDSEEDTFCHHDCESQNESGGLFESNDAMINQAEGSETTTNDCDDIHEIDPSSAMDFYFHSTDIESGEEIPMKGVLFPLFGNIQTVCWENLKEGNFCYCTVLTE